MQERKTPERMCIACRNMIDKRKLILIVRSPEGVFSIDFTGKKSGRGAYVCDNADCIDKCMKQRLLNRNFKCEIPLEVYEELADAYKSRKD